MGFLGAWGMSMQSLGCLLEVLFGSVTPCRQTNIANPCLKQWRKKSYNMALKTRTQTHQTKDVTALNSTTPDSHFSWQVIQLLRCATLPDFSLFVKLRCRDHLSRVTPMKDDSFLQSSFLWLTFWVLTFPPTPCLLLTTCTTFYQTTSQSPSPVKPPAT